MRVILKFCHYFIFLWRAEKRWLFPHKSDVLIFDACGEELLREYFMGHSIEVLHVRGEVINVPTLITSLLYPGKRSEAYFDVYIRKVSPKLAITFIDNSISFYTLSARHPMLQTMFIQNGWRSYHGDVFEKLDQNLTLGENYAVNYMMCFGEISARHYQRYIKGLCIPIGSLRNNKHERFSNRRVETILYISQWQGKKIDIDFKVDSLILKFLHSFSLRVSKRLQILPRFPNVENIRNREADYFSEILGAQCDFLHFDTPGSAYHAIDYAEIIVGVDSTLLYESIARGGKTAIFSIRGAIISSQGLDFGWPGTLPSSGPFWTSTPSQVEFDRVLQYLVAVNKDDWEKELRDVFSSKLMLYDQGNSVLVNTLKQILKD